MEDEKKVVAAEEKREPSPVIVAEKVTSVACPVCEARRRRLAEKMRAWRTKKK